MQRFKDRSQFQAALAGKTWARTDHFALQGMAWGAAVVPGASGPLPTTAALSSVFPGGADLWLGAMTPKRWARRAVTRNTIKRQIYNVSLQFESALPLGAFVVRLRTSFDRSHFVSATSEALRLVVRAELQQLFEVASRRAADTLRPKDMVPCATC